MEIASALLAGVLARFGMQAFGAAQTALGMVLAMLAACWAAPAAPLCGGADAAGGRSLGGGQRQMEWSRVHWELALPVFTAPSSPGRPLSAWRCPVCGDHGLAEHAGRGGDPRHGL
jgi:benzoate membrane transport protein